MPRIELTMLVGRYAREFLLAAGPRASMTHTVAAWRDHPATLLPLPHPSWRNTAWLKRNPWFERELLPVLRRRVAGLVQTQR